MAQNQGLSPARSAGQPVSPRAGWWHSLAGRLAVAGWSALIATLFHLIHAARYVLPKLRPLIDGRVFANADATALAQAAAAHSRRYLFFCSSAGEYEQALPLIDRLRERQGALVLTVFFSPSGLRFAKARGEPGPYLLAPADTSRNWQRLLASLAPQAVVVVRHELWPAFLASVCRHGCPLYLINASYTAEGQARRSRPWRLYAETRLLACFDRIYTVSGKDQAYFAALYPQLAERLFTAGDTKYDRVCERAQRARAAAGNLRQLLEERLPARWRLVVGSAWQADVELCLAAFADLQRRGYAEQGLQVIMVLHEPSPQALASVAAVCQQHGLTSCLWSEVLSAEMQLKPRGSPSPCQVVVVDRLGILAELYSVAQLAFVGGALHHQVHNVLEPASYGLALAYGPLYKNSGEAVRLVEAGLARVVATPSELTAWWEEAMAAPLAAAAATTAFLAQACGAADQIYAEL